MKKARLTTRGRSFLSAGLTLLVGGVVLGFLDVVRLGGLLLALVVATWWLSRRGDRRVEVARRLQPDVVTAGSRCAITLTFTNTDPRDGSKVTWTGNKTS